MKRLNQIVCTICLVMLVSACSTVHFQSSNKKDPLYLERPGKGVLLVKKSQKVLQSVQIRLQWHQNTEKTQLDILSPFGTSYGQFTYKPKEGTELRTPFGVQKGESAEQLLKKHTGFVMPVSGMRYWVKGIVIPNERVDSFEKNNQGQYTHIMQQGWDIHLSQYDDQGPKRIHMKHLLPDGRSFSVQLIF